MRVKMMRIMINCHRYSSLYLVSLFRMHMHEIQRYS